MEILLAIGGLAVVLWLVVVFLRGGLVGGALVLLLASSCFSSPFFSMPTPMIPLTADRLLFVVLLAQYMVYQRWGWTTTSPLDAKDFILMAFISVLVASTISHDFQSNKFLPLSQLLFFYLMPAAVYWVARRTPLEEGQVLAIILSLSVFGVYLAVTAIAETQQAWGLVFPGYIVSNEYKEFLGRGRGPFLNPITMGSFISVSLFAALMWWPRLRRNGQLTLVATLVPLFLLGIYCTLTRSVWLGAAAGLTVLVGLAVPRQWRVSVVGTLLLSGTVGMLAGWEYFSAFKRDRDVTATQMAESARLRPILATIAWKMFEDRPILGCGFGHYGDESRNYFSDRTTDLPLEKGRPFVQHNVFLGLLTETGALGLGLFLLVMAGWAGDAWRAWRNVESPLWVRQCGLLMLASLAVYVVNGMFHNVAIMPGFQMLFFYLAGVAASVAPLAVVPNDVPPRLRLLAEAANPN